MAPSPRSRQTTSRWETQGVGYLVIVPNPYLFKIGETRKIFIYQKVAEARPFLVRLRIRGRKGTFLKLISVVGIGPKSAKAILAAGSVASIQNVDRDRQCEIPSKIPGHRAKGEPADHFGPSRQNRIVRSDTGENRHAQRSQTKPCRRLGTTRRKSKNFTETRCDQTDERTHQRRPFDSC
ncbi:MAG: helix-hairpin-helix domain-containing protein [Bacillus subtilis]|nr:helix-hairpin-helix domain-containing protein [Bacillus subtilis]